MTDDDVAVMKLAEKYLGVTRQFYQRSGYTKGNILTALNAEAYSIATVLVGTNGEARPFFDAALAQALAYCQELQEKLRDQSKKMERSPDRDAWRDKRASDRGVSRPKGVRRAKHLK